VQLKTNFSTFLKAVFGEDKAKELVKAYFIGKSKMDNGNASIFWQVDSEQRVRTGKIMCYDPETGKRKKGELFSPKWVHGLLGKPFTYKQCLFGEHLLKEYPNDPVALVESEKTAIIATGYMPQYLWLATGGLYGAKWGEHETYKHFKNRKVILFPDHGFANIKTGKTCYDAWNERANHIRETVPCNISVSRLLEDGLDRSALDNGYDIADFLVKKEAS
jgi:hypothetical protein